MDENGLFDFWWKQFSANPTYCFHKIQQQINQKGRKDKKPLTLKSLSGAFLVLCIEYTLAIAAFIVETAVPGHRRIDNETKNRIVKIINNQRAIVDQAQLIRRVTKIATAIIRIGDHIHKPVVNKQVVVINQIKNVQPKPKLEIHPVLPNPLDVTPTEAVLNLTK